MVNRRCVMWFWAFTIGIGCVSALHPVAHSLSSRTSGDESSAHSSSEENVVGAIPVHEFKDNSISIADDYNKRGSGMNFLRFGKSYPPMVSALQAPRRQTAEEKRAASLNMIPLGKAAQKNFLRMPNISPREFGLGFEDEASQEVFHYPDGALYERYPKAANRNYLRFGRSTQAQMKNDCHDCVGESRIPSSHDDDPSTFPSYRKKSGSPMPSPLQKSSTNRAKRSVSAFYDDVEFMPGNPSSWVSQYAGTLPELRSVMVGSPASDELANPNQKRSYNRSFLRYGRDPLDLHFLRFGKRMASPEDNISSDEDRETYIRTARAGGSLKNFLRFG